MPKGVYARNLRPIEDRFWSKVKKTTDCWLWEGALRKGYGEIAIGRRGDGMMQTHRLAYLTLVGDIPDGLELDHLCRVRHCVNPDHLEAVTRAVNVQRGLIPGIMSARGRAITHCIKGHEYTKANTYLRPEGNRRCRICQRQWSKNRLQKMKVTDGTLA